MIGRRCVDGAKREREGETQPGDLGDDEHEDEQLGFCSTRRVSILGGEQKKRRGGC